MKQMFIDSDDPNTIAHDVGLFFQNNDDDYIRLVFTQTDEDLIVGRNQKLKTLIFDAKIPD